MSLLTGTPLGSVTSQEEINITDAPYIYFQDSRATELHNPDADNYYYGLSGTTAYPVYNMGCYQDVQFTEDVTLNVVRCDTVGDKGATQRRNYLEFSFTILHLLPLSVAYNFLNASVPTKTAPFEKMGIGKINNNRFFHLYVPKVYDDDTGDYLIFHIHKAQFVDAWNIGMRSGDPWQVSGVKLRAYADDTKPANQVFATVVRLDPSAIT